jgi:protein-disulfide isomerase
MKLSAISSAVALVVSLGTAGFVGYNYYNHSGATSAPMGSIDSSIHTYMMSHPEIIMQMVQKLRQKQAEKMQADASDAAKAVLAHHAKFVDGKHAIQEGNKNAPITIVEFFDYQCSACAATYPELHKFLQSPYAQKNVRVVYRSFPFFGPASVYAAKAVIAAEAQGKSMDLHNALFKSGLIEHKMQVSDVLSMAKKIPGMNIAKLKTDIDATWVKQELLNDANLVKSLKLIATPAFVFTPTSTKLANAKNTKFINSGMPAAAIAANVKSVSDNM